MMQHDAHSLMHARVNVRLDPCLFMRLGAQTCQMWSQMCREVGTAHDATWAASLLVACLVGSQICRHTTGTVV